MFACLRVLIFAAISGIWAVNAPAAEKLDIRDGKVIRVSDGDTLTMLTPDMLSLVVRLTDIDAPETAHGKGRPGQPFSEKASHHLRGLAIGKEARAICYDVDARVAVDGSRRERLICRVLIDGVDLSHAMVRDGLAMANRQNKRYVRDPLVYRLEEESRLARRGLWADEAPTPPWTWRRQCWNLGECER